ncbi:MAG: shikimate dehydrogenase [Anaerolineae bacterium]|nr:shikimate dehydrogenase [Anaerolineae bacterium]
MTRVFLIGDPIARSLSPAMHNAAFQNLGLDVRYELLETPPHKLREAIARVRADDCLGANVTIPHKESVIQYLDDVDAWARTIGSVNTLFKRDGKLIGASTDGEGFLHALRDARVEVQNARVVILGAGGAARAVAFALARAKVASIAILNRTPARAQLLADLVRAHSPIDITANDERAIEHATLIVNTTPAGALPPGTNFPREAIVFDLVYHHTDFLRAAERAGARAIDGLGMLVYQGAASFKMWTGHDAPVSIMWQAVQ